MRTPSALAVALATMLAGTAGAQTSTPDASGAGHEPASKLICVRSQAETGSHLGAGKVCHTESEWAMIRNQSGHMMERYETLQNRQPIAAGGR